MLYVCGYPGFAKKALRFDFRITKVVMQGFVGNGPEKVFVGGGVEFAGSTLCKVLEIVILEGTAFPCGGEDMVGVPRMEGFFCLLLDHLLLPQTIMVLGRIIKREESFSSQIEG